LDQCFGRFNKNALTQLLLTGDENANECASAAFQFLVQSGGSVAYLHGATFVYEFIASLCITIFCTFVVDIFLAKWDIFSEPCVSTTAVYCAYIQEKNGTLAAAALVAFIAAFNWMSLWNQTGDVLLYCVAWNRKMHFKGEESGLDEDMMIGSCGEYCPQTLRVLLPPHELSPHFEHGLHAHGVGQVGAIVAAMEHNVTQGDAPSLGIQYTAAGAMNMFSTLNA